MHKKVARLLLGNGSFMLAQWFMLSFLAHTSGPEKVGMFSLAVSIATPLAVLCGLAGRTLLQTDIGKNARPFKEHWQLRLIGMLVFTFVLLITAIYRQDSSPVFWLIIVMIGYKGIDSLSDITYGLAQRSHHVDIMSYSLLWRGLIGFVVFVIGFMITNNLAISVVAATIGWAAFFYWHDWRLTKQWHGNFSGWNFKRLGKMAWQALPLGIAVFLSGFALVIPRLLLEHYSGLESLGIFAALAYTLTLGNLMVGSIANTLLTKLTELWAAKNIREYLRIVGLGTFILLGCGIVGTLTAWLFGEEILTIIYGKEFAPYGDLFTLVAAAATLVMIGTFWGYVLIGTKTFKTQLAVHAVNIILVGGACLWLITKYHEWGAAWALMVLGTAKCGSSIVNFLYAYFKHFAGTPTTD